MRQRHHHLARLRSRTRSRTHNPLDIQAQTAIPVACRSASYSKRSTRLLPLLYVYCVPRLLTHYRRQDVSHHSEVVVPDRTSAGPSGFGLSAFCAVLHCIKPAQPRSHCTRAPPLSIALTRRKTASRIHHCSNLGNKQVVHPTQTLTNSNSPY